MRDLLAIVLKAWPKLCVDPPDYPQQFKRAFTALRSMPRHPEGLDNVRTNKNDIRLNKHVLVARASEVLKERGHPDTEITIGPFTAAVIA